MNNKYYVLIRCSAVIIALIVGIVTRISFVDVDKIQIADLKQYTVTNGGGVFETEEEVNLSAMVNDAEYIIKAAFAGERKYLQGTCLTAVKVEQSYKGESDLKGKIIYIYEPSYFDFENKLFHPYNGYNLIKADEKYILFIKKWPYTQYMEFNPYYKNKDIYILAHNSAIDKYTINSISFNKIVQDGQDSYGELGDYEIFAYNKYELDRYNNIKADVLRQFK